MMNERRVDLSPVDARQGSKFRWARRVPAVMGSALVAATCLMAGPPAVASTMTTQTATAAWLVNGPISENISLQATKGSGPGLSNLFFQVNEQFCDSVRNQEVFRNFTNMQTGRQSAFVVFRRLSGAVLAVPALRMSGIEQRFQGCGSPSGTPRTISLGTSTVELVAAWQATGPITVRQPGTVGRTASAVALESSSGRLNLGDLGPAQSAEIDQSTS